MHRKRLATQIFPSPAAKAVEESRVRTSSSFPSPRLWNSCAVDYFCGGERRQREPIFGLWQHTEEKWLRALPMLLDPDFFTRTMQNRFGCRNSYCWRQSNSRGFLYAWERGQLLHRFLSPLILDPADLAFWPWASTASGGGMDGPSHRHRHPFVGIKSELGRGGSDEGNWWPSYLLVLDITLPLSLVGSLSCSISIYLNSLSHSRLSLNLLPLSLSRDSEQVEARDKRRIVVGRSVS
jgi:hypothetical protein